MRKKIIVCILVIIGFYNLIAIATIQMPQIDYSIYNIEIQTQGNGQVHSNDLSFSSKEDKNLILTVDDIDDEFIVWEIKGSYSIIKGNMNSKILEIQPSSGLSINAIFKSKATNQQLKTLNHNVKINKNLKSPQTGDFRFIIIQ